MARYIDADAIIQEAHHERKTIVTIELIEHMPTADVRENVRGEWCYREDRNGQDGYMCDQCGEFFPWHYRTMLKLHSYHKTSQDLICRYNFCPNCGADMRGEKDG